MSLLTKMLPPEPFALQRKKQTHINYSRLFVEGRSVLSLVKSSAQTHTQRERKHILKLQKGVILLPCLILEASASLFPSYRSHHQCYYGF